MSYSLQKIMPSNTLFEAAMAIYDLSFPDNEKQPRPVIEQRLQDRICTLFVVLINQKVVGIVILWEFDGTRFSFLDYLAVHPKYRSKGIGSFCMQQICAELKKECKNLIIEVEDPDCGQDRENKLRRIHFYEKCGAQWLADTPYELPALDGTDPTPMIIMIVPSQDTTHFEGEEIREIFKLMYYSVYGRSQNDPLLLTFLHKTKEHIPLKKYSNE